MAEFVEVIKAKHRMCMSFFDCADCLLGCYDCATPTGDEIAEVEKTILEWAAEHPEPKKKTMLDVFHEKFPHARFNSFSHPAVCASDIFDFACNSADCFDCWNRPAPDEYQDGGEQA